MASPRAADPGPRSPLTRLASWWNGGSAVGESESIPVKANGHSNGNGNGHSPSVIRLESVQTKASNSLLPQLNGIEPEFFSSDGGNTFIWHPKLGGPIGLAFAAYWYVAVRWRAQKIAEAPLMVVREDKTDGSEEWLPDHELAEILDSPSPDFDMGELLERTSRYLDNTGAALWVIDRDRAGRIARITPFRRDEFQVLQTSDRIYGKFIVQVEGRPLELTPDRVCYFRDDQDTGWQGGYSRLRVAMSWLALGEQAKKAVTDLLVNSVWPSGVVMPDKDWKPTQQELDQYKQALEQYGDPSTRGKPMVMLGGGSWETISARIRDLVPTDILNRVESVVAAVSGVPAIVLQFQVGMENSPWSQMEEARKMAYDDTIQPVWRRMERVLTRQLLRIEDDDPTHFVRFDRSAVAALQDDRQEAATTASLMGRAATLNERRVLMGLEPSDDPRADEIPELVQPVPAPFGNGNPDSTDGEPDPTAGTKARHFSVSVLASAFQQESKTTWELEASHQLRTDAQEIERIVRDRLGSEKAKSGSTVDRVMAAVEAYLEKIAAARWLTLGTRLSTTAAERVTAVQAAELGITYEKLRPYVIEFAEREAGKFVKEIDSTTRDTIRTAIADGLRFGHSHDQIARDIAESGAFSKSRAALIAQTESNAASNGGPVEALQSYAKATGRRFTKRWKGKLDSRERDEHIAMEGETRFIDKPFSNGEQYPASPNCRCVTVLSEVSDE